ncbi:type I polyketide synthase [Chloroflexia bacterium SDU3-3]|nr:type I polyketide synthase [Chloroflexia bacterium SDU3-3]
MDHVHENGKDRSAGASQRSAGDAAHEPIAIIGLGCRFPQANGPQAFWKLLLDGVDTISEIPSTRFKIDDYYDPRPGTPGKMATRWGGFIDEVDRFDNYFFGISPREAETIDPQQRVLLEVSWEALEDAGQIPERLKDVSVGVFMGLCNSDYGNILFDDINGIDLYVSSGSAHSVLSGRLSYALGFQGPSMTVDTACSSSLVAVHLACQSIWTGESKLALAGGVNLIFWPNTYMGFARANMLAPDGRCKFGDASANGFVRSDGAGVVVLKPLAAALEDGDPIYSVIRGSAVNNDGNSGGLLMTPSQPGQEAVFAEAYRVAGITPGDVAYVEAHGTGTSVGDPTEIQALAKVLGQGRREGQPCLLGSVKTNIGHTEGAAGIAGMIKVALALKHGVIPPSLHFNTPNPHIPWDELPVQINTQTSEWPGYTPTPYASVSSFGISGTNAHIVMSALPPAAVKRPEAKRLAPPPDRPTVVHDPAYLLPLSAQSKDALLGLARSYSTFFQEGEKAASLHNICYTASARRTHHDYRLSLVGRSPADFVEQIDLLLSEESEEAKSGTPTSRWIGEKRKKLVFAFSGQGSQWVGLGRRLLVWDPVFRAAIERCDAVMREFVDWSLIDEVMADESQSRLSEVDVIQPFIFATQVALAELWRSWGVEPDAVVGQSMGEVAAAYVAGAISLKDAARIICMRSKIVKNKNGASKGGMMVVGLSLEESKKLIEPYSELVSIGVSTSPVSTVLSGDTDMLDKIMSELDQRNVFCRRIKVDYASHSPQVDPLIPELTEALKDVAPRAGTIPMFSTVTNSITDGSNFDVNYWVHNLRDPVLFSSAIHKLLDDGHEIFLEISPHPVVMSAIEQSLKFLGRSGKVLPSIREGEGRAFMLRSLGELYTMGYPVDWQRLYPAGGEIVPLPAYPWQGEKFWMNPDADAAGDGRRANAKGLLIGQHMHSAQSAGHFLWETSLGLKNFAYLTDHRVQGAIVLPAAAYVEMALSAASEAFGPGSHKVEKVDFEKALFLPEQGSRRIQLIVAPNTLGGASFEFYSMQDSAPGQQPTWTRHAAGLIRVAPVGAIAPSREPEDIAQIRERCAQVIQRPEFYASMDARGLQYGPMFQGVDEIAWQPGEALGKLTMADAVKAEGHGYQVHPALLDVCFQILAGAMLGDADKTGGGTYLPVHLGGIQLYGSPGESGVWGHAFYQSSADMGDDCVEGDVFLLDESGALVMEVRGLRAMKLERSAAASAPKLDDWLYEPRWEQQPLVAPEAAKAAKPGAWMLFADQGGVAQQIKAKLEERGETCVVVSDTVSDGTYLIDPTDADSFAKLVKEALPEGQKGWRGIMHLWSLDAPASESLVLADMQRVNERGSFCVMKLIQALAASGSSVFPKLWVVTAGSQAAGAPGELVSVAQAPLWGLGKVAGVEHPELHCTKVDLSYAPSEIEVDALYAELWGESKEDQVALRGSERYVPRIVRSSADEWMAQREQLTFDDAFRLEITTPGILDNLTLRRFARRKPGPGEVELRVRAAGLNFREVLIAMDMLPPVMKGAMDIGWECAGTVVAVGEGVTDVKVGEDVIGIAAGCFGSYVTTSATLVARKPDRLTAEQAATIPVAFLTAYYALTYLGRMEKGDKVLIHAAAGGVGQAAVQLAKQAGAEIFATAGSDEKRALLRAQGVEHIMDSRSLDFADQVMEITGGRGVDLVLNSLSGDFIPKGLATLAPGGRFLEIGKVDIVKNSQLGMHQLENNISFMTIDLGQMFVTRPDVWARFLREIIALFNAGEIEPLPMRHFPLSQAPEAFRFMAQGKHIGKVVLTMDEDVLPVAPAKNVSFPENATYLITGGAGGLGLSVAQWMVDAGARNLVLVGRSGASAAASEFIAKIEERGANVVVMKADISNTQQVDDLLSEVRRTLPPLKGIFHAAGVLDDGILVQLTPERFKPVMAPKVDGAWNLHTLTLKDELDYFVVFSSCASVLGSPGQANYVAGNSFLDALAAYRRELGLPGMAINWGAWADVGLAIRSDRAQNLDQQGVLPFSPAQGVQLMEKMMQRNPTQIMGVTMDWPKVLAAYNSPMLSVIAAEQQSTGDAAAKRRTDGLTQEKLLQAEPSARRGMVETFLLEQVAKVLRTSSSKLDVNLPLNKMGIDSLMAVELKNRIETAIELSLPVTTLLQGPSVAQLADVLMEQLPADEATAEAAIASEAEVEEMSDEEVDAMLSSMIDDK